LTVLKKKSVASTPSAGVATLRNRFSLMRMTRRRRSMRRMLVPERNLSATVCGEEWSGFMGCIRIAGSPPLGLGRCSGSSKVAVLPGRGGRVDHDAPRVGKVKDVTRPPSDAAIVECPPARRSTPRPPRPTRRERATQGSFGGASTGRRPAACSNRAPSAPRRPSEPPRQEIPCGRAYPEKDPWVARSLPQGPRPRAGAKPDTDHAVVTSNKA
jgi:hypothetical protein